jgi:thiol-disulfide isomerase/thioredoxin
MGERSGDILGVEPFVYIDRDVDALHDLCRPGGETATPGGIGGRHGRDRLLAGHQEDRRERWSGTVTRLLIRVLTVLLVLCLGALGMLAWRMVTGDRTGPMIAQEAPDQGSFGEFSPLAAPRPAPEVEFANEAGRRLRLSDFRGQMVLVNLWATWCGPCVEEMPSLDRLAAKLGRDLTIVAIAEDRGGAAAVNRFLARHPLTALSPYLDPGAGASLAFRAGGLPTSYLIDRQGNILGELDGAAEWDSPAMTALLEHYLRKPPLPAVEKTSSGG